MRRRLEVLNITFGCRVACVTQEERHSWWRKGKGHLIGDPGPVTQPIVLSLWGRWAGGPSYTLHTILWFAIGRLDRDTGWRMPGACKPEEGKWRGQDRSGRSLGSLPRILGSLPVVLLAARVTETTCSPCRAAYSGGHTRVLGSPSHCPFLKGSARHGA